MVPWRGFVSPLPVPSLFLSREIYPFLISEWQSAEITWHDIIFLPEKYANFSAQLNLNSLSVVGSASIQQYKNALSKTLSPHTNRSVAMKKTKFSEKTPLRKAVQPILIFVFLLIVAYVAYKAYVAIQNGMK